MTDTCKSVLREMIQRWAPHCGLCCVFTASGDVSVTAESCVCEDLHKRARKVISKDDETQVSCKLWTRGKFVAETAVQLLAGKVPASYKYHACVDAVDLAEELWSVLIERGHVR